MKLVKVEDAVGQVLCHDMTRIVKGEMKGPQFKKGHVVKEEDIPMLLSMGKEHIYIWEKNEDMLHEDEAALILKSFCMNDHLSYSEASEGKIEVKAECDGLLKVNVDALNAVNTLENMIIATRKGNTTVRKGDKVAAMRVVPLIIEKAKMQEAKEIFESQAVDSLIEIKPFKDLKAGLITTGSEVAKGRIKDTFTPVIIEKLKAFGIEILYHEYSEDDLDQIVTHINDMKSKEIDMILCTGGMSVDPDDKTPGAIKASGANIVTYGAPVLPGAMFLLGYYEDGKAVMGLPGCVMYARSTIFDIVLPRIATGERIERADLVKLGNGGLCLGCEVCHFPNCGFGSH